MSDAAQEILAGWDDDEPTDEIATPVPAQTEPEPDEPDETPDEGEEPAEEEPEEEEGEEPEEAETEEGEEPEEGEEAELLFDTDDAEVIAFMRKYQDDPERAIKGAVQLQRAMGRQGQEKAVLARRAADLERQLQQAQAFNAGQPFLSEEQRNWVENAVDSGAPLAFVRAAVDEGEFELARAVCAAWSAEDAFSAMRAVQAVDVAELNSRTSQIEAQPLETGDLLGILVEHYPDLPQYQQEMAKLISTMGDAHPLVEDARSRDPQVAARGIIGLYEVARAQTTRLSAARDKVKKTRRAESDNAKRAAQVSSAAVAPSPGETPRDMPLMPGLTLEQLDAEWASDGR